MGGDVCDHRDRAHRVTWFRVEGLIDVEDDPVLRVHDEALDEGELGLKTILEDFEQQKLPEELLAHPTIHRPYGKGDARKIPRYEEMRIRCDGHAYRVRRDERGDVIILDKNDQALTNLPPNISKLIDSVCMRTEQDWCYDVQRSLSDAPGKG